MEAKINLDFHRRLSLLVGICYPMPKQFEERPKWIRLLWMFYGNFSHAMMILELLSQFMRIGVSIDNIEVLSTCTLSTVYLLQYLLKIYIFYNHKKTFERVFNQLSQTSKSLIKKPLQDDNFETLYSYYYTIFMKIGIYKGGFQMACNVSLSLFFCLSYFMGMKRSITPANGWTPYDTSKDPAYTITCLYEVICYGMVTAKCIALDLLFSMMLVVPMVQLNYLSHLMSLILRDGGETERAHNEAVLNFSEEEYEYSQNILHSRLKWWINHHQMILRNMKEFQSLASSFLAVNYASSLIDLFISGIVITSESSKWHVVQKTFINGVVVTDILQLYFLSLAGDMLRESSEKVANLGFTAFLFKMKKCTRQKYLFILTRAGRCTEFRFAGVNPLSSNTFFRLLQLTISYTVTMAQVKNSKFHRPNERDWTATL